MLTRGVDLAKIRHAHTSEPSVHAMDVCVAIGCSDADASHISATVPLCSSHFLFLPSSA